MEKKSGIYMWTSPSGKSYIGQSVDLQKRKGAFLRFGDRYGGEKINCARKKYNHKSLWNYKVLEYCGIDKLDERERYYIELYDTINNGYNCESGGNENKIVSDESKQKMSEAMKGENNPMWGKHFTKEQKRKISESRKGKCCGEKNPNYRKHLTEEQKRKLSEAKKGEKNPLYGKHLTEEHKSKLSEAMKGKYCGEKHPMWGKHRDDETRIKISKALDKRKIPVSQYTIEGVFIASYESINEAQRLTNIYRATISRCCKGIQKTAGGFKWSYKNPPLLKE